MEAGKSCGVVDPSGQVYGTSCNREAGHEGQHDCGYSFDDAIFGRRIEIAIRCLKQWDITVADKGVRLAPRPATGQPPTSHG